MPQSDIAPRFATLPLQGPLTLSHLGVLRATLAAAPQNVVISLAGTGAMDTAGAWVLATYLRDTAPGSSIVEATQAQELLLQTVTAHLPPLATQLLPNRRKVLQHQRLDALERLGRAVVTGLNGLAEVLGFFGLILVRVGRTIVQPSRLRLTATVHHMQDVGLNAVPIVALMAFLIGIVLAFQGADQLRQFGAEVFVVDLIALSILRELGILLTAIIVAGRSASAITASIGSMKMREEIDAMRTLGLDPIEVLVLPRLIALFVMLPVLGFVADIAGLVGGGLMSWATLGLSPGVFQTRLLQTDVIHFVVGLSKAPFFAVIIAVIGCFQGFKVQGNSESLGQLTSRSVVQAIFMVILADATFSIFFAGMGL